MASNVDVSVFIDLSKFADELAFAETEAATKVALGRAKKNVRRDESTLGRSIESEVRGNVGTIGTDVEYAAAQEYGLQGQPSRQAEPGTPKSGPGGPYTFNPFLRKAAKTTAEDLRRGKITPLAVRKAFIKARLSG
jgi:phage gpG-like protein